MKRFRNRPARAAAVTAIAVLLCACQALGRYELVTAGGMRRVADDMAVRTTQAWNRVPRLEDRIKEREVWTRHGPSIDSVEFTVGLREGDTLLDSKSDVGQQLPPFRADMRRPELVAMFETYYRLRLLNGTLDVTRVRPQPFMDADGVRMEFRYTGNDDVRRNGCAVMAIVDGRLYAMALTATSIHYYHETLSDFEAMVASAEVR